MSLLAARQRWLVVVAHPDDEVLGCGALLSRLPDVEVVHVTDGAPRRGDDARRRGFETPAAYAASRWREARAALALAGVSETHHHGFGVADQDAAYRLVDVARRLSPVVERADAVLTHAYEGGHPDHDAVAFAVHAAVRRASGRQRPIVEMPFYHAGSEDWVRQQFLPGTDVDVDCLSLSETERDLKRRMAACHATQGDTLASFDLARELFRLAPAYDFDRLPHDGDLLYERHGWNLDRDGWLAAVRAAETDLDFP